MDEMLNVFGQYPAQVSVQIEARTTAFTGITIAPIAPRTFEHHKTAYKTTDCSSVVPNWSEGDGASPAGSLAYC